MRKLFFVALLSSLAIGSARADSDLMSLIGNNWGDDYAAISNSGSDKYNNASSYNLSTSDHNSFAVDYGDNGVIRGHGRCSTRNGTYPWSNGTYDVISTNFVDNLTNETGQSGARYCYCGLDSYTPVNGSAQSLSGPWVLFSNGVWDGASCAENCADGCADNLANGIPESLAFRAAVFNAYAPSSSASGDAITTQTYVDNKLATKQARITTTGTNKLMTFGSSAGNIGTKDIVSTLGTSTTATTVPEVGPIVTGLNGKQNTVNGTANYVMTGTGTAGTVGEKPVYSPTTNYTNALVTAQTINTAAATAANSELSCIDNDCLLWQINTSGPTGISTRIYLDPSINRTSWCWRNKSLNQNIPDQNNDCSASTVAYLGNLDNRSGKWGAVFPYGDIMGKSVCISIQGTQNVAATDAQTTQLNTVYNQASPSGKYCWCKMEFPAESSWIYRGQEGSDSSACGQQCARGCGQTGMGWQNFRAAMFNTVQ